MGPSFIELWNRYQMEKRAKDALSKATSKELQKVWEEWDGVEVMKLDGVYIPDSWIVAELGKRGLDAL